MRGVNQSDWQRTGSADNLPSSMRSPRGAGRDLMISSNQLSWQMKGDSKIGPAYLPSSMQSPFPAAAPPSDRDLIGGSNQIDWQLKGSAPDLPSSMRSPLRAAAPPSAISATGFLDPSYADARHSCCGVGCCPLAAAAAAAADGRSMPGNTTPAAAPMASATRRECCAACCCCSLGGGCGSAEHLGTCMTQHDSFSDDASIDRSCSSVHSAATAVIFECSTIVHEAAYTSFKKMHVRRTMTRAGRACCGLPSIATKGRCFSFL